MSDSGADSPACHRVVLGVAAALLLGAGLGATDFWAPDEPRYGQVAEEIRSFANGAQGLVLMHLGGEPYTQKPPLYYWLAALVGAPVGRVTEIAARLPSALAGAATVALVFAFARRIFPGPAAALLSAGVLLTSFRFAHLARRAQLDVLLTLFETLALFAFWRIESRGDDAPVDARAVAIFHGALGAAALTKGPVGWIPLVVVAAYLAWQGRPGRLRAWVPAWALLLSVAPVVAWIAGATWLAPTGFFQEAVIANLVERAVSAESHVRPAFYYLYQLPADALPWSLLWPVATVAAWYARPIAREIPGPGAPRPWRLLALWIAVPLLLFSLVSGKRGLYLLPAFPALALALGGAVDRILCSPGRAGTALRVALALAGAGLAAAAATVALQGGIGSARLPGFEFDAASAWTLSALAAAGLLAGWRLGRNRPTAAFEAALVTVLAIELVIFVRVYPALDAEKSPRGIALAVAAESAPGERVGVFDDAGLAGGILYYGDRGVAILPRPEHVARFLERGGRLVVFERWKLPWLDPVGRFRIHAATRSGPRELVVASLEADSQESP